MKRQTQKDALDDLLILQKTRLLEIAKLSDVAQKITAYKELIETSKKILDENQTPYKDQALTRQLRGKIKAQISIMEQNQLKASNLETIAVDVSTETKPKLKEPVMTKNTTENKTNQDYSMVTAKDQSKGKEWSSSDQFSLDEFLSTIGLTKKTLTSKALEDGMKKWSLSNHPDKVAPELKTAAKEKFQEWQNRKDVLLMFMSQEKLVAHFKKPKEMQRQLISFLNKISDTDKRFLIQKSDQAIQTELSRPIGTATPTPSQHNFETACSKMSDLTRKLCEKEVLSFDDAFDLTLRTASLIDNPEEHKSFLATAKKYDKPMFGKLLAYAQAAAGFAAELLKIVKKSEWREVGNAKLDYFDAAKSLAKSAEASVAQTPVARLLVQLTTIYSFDKIFSDIAQSVKKYFDKAEKANKTENTATPNGQTNVNEILVEIEGLTHTVTEEIKKDLNLSGDIKTELTSMVSEVDNKVRERILQGTSHHALLGELKHLKGKLDHKLETLAVEHQMDLTDAKETFKFDLEKSQSSVQKLAERLTQKGSSQIESIAIAIEKYRTDLRNEITEWESDKKTLLQQLETNESLIKSRRETDKTRPRLLMVKETLKEALAELEGRIAVHKENMGKLTKQLESKATSTNQKTEARIKLLTAVKDIIAENRKIELSKKQEEITSVFQRNERELNKTHLYEGGITLNKAIKQLEDSLSLHTPASGAIEHKLKDVEKHEAKEKSEYENIKAELEKAKGHVELSRCFDTLLKYATQEMEHIETKSDELEYNKKAQNTYKLDKYSGLKVNIEKALERFETEDPNKVLGWKGARILIDLHDIEKEIKVKLKETKAAISEAYKKELKSVTDDEKLNKDTRLDKGMS